MFNRIIDTILVVAIVGLLAKIAFAQAADRFVTVNNQCLPMLQKGADPATCDNAKSVVLILHADGTVGWK